MVSIISALTDSAEALESALAAVRDAGVDWVITSTTRLSPAIRQYFRRSRVLIRVSQAIERLFGPSQYVDPGYYRHHPTRLLDTLY